MTTQHTTEKTPRWPVRREVHWWTRWLLRYFPGQALRRLRHCLRHHEGPLLDGVACLTCGAPWFFDHLRRPRRTPTEKEAIQ